MTRLHYKLRRVCALNYADMAYHLLAHIPSFLDSILERGVVLCAALKGTATRHTPQKRRGLGRTVPPADDTQIVLAISHKAAYIKVQSNL